MKVGDSANLQLVGRTDVGADGSFDLRADPAISLDAFASSIGNVSLEVIADGSAGRSVFNFSRKLDALTPATAAAKPASGTQLAAAAPSAGPATVTLELYPALGGAIGGEGVPAPLDKIGVPICTTILKQTYSPVWGLVAELYTGPHATVDFSYTSGAESELGIGLSASGAGATFSQSGKVSVGTSATLDFATVPINQRRVEETKFEYGKYEVVCVGAHYEARPKRWYGGSTYYNAASTPANSHCASYQKGDGVKIDQHRPSRGRTGSKIDSVIGVDLSIKNRFTSRQPRTGSSPRLDSCAARAFCASRCHDRGAIGDLKA